mmetsp:Transcript_3664/g.6938  ORF Transcript_3664/g.6938 Transcript_3664/m.6938 type:complete len:104 (+) Transcript_3664:410-721(+)
MMDLEECLMRKDLQEGRRMESKYSRLIFSIKKDLGLRKIVPLTVIVVIYDHVIYMMIYFIHGFEFMMDGTLLLCIRVGTGCKTDYKCKYRIVHHNYDKDSLEF